MKNLFKIVLLLISISSFGQRELPVKENDKFTIRRTYSTGISQFTPAPNPTDIFALRMTDYQGICRISKVFISGIADSAKVVEVLLQYAPNSSGGSSVVTANAPFEGLSRLGTQKPQLSPSVSPIYFTANDGNSGRNGVSSDRPLIRDSFLQFSTSTTKGNTIEWAFNDNERGKPQLIDLVGWIVVNLKGQAMPSNAKLSITVEYEFVKMPRISFFGDSTYFAAIDLFTSLLKDEDLINTAIDNLGCNGYRLTDFLNNTNGITYPLIFSYGRCNDVAVIGYGINDVRTGATTQSELIVMLDSTIARIKRNAPTSKIILHIPNSLTTDNFGGFNYVTTTGIFTGLTLSQAAQQASDIMWNAYKYFETNNGGQKDTRVYAIVDRQQITGRVCTTVANSNGLMTDQLHPSPKGRRVIAQQLKPTLVAATQSVINENY